MSKKPKKFIFVVGGVMSSVGKGVTSASISAIMQGHGYRTVNVKCDMYVNIDAGTMRPTEHGEVFVGDDGIESDQDLGNYERFTGQRSTARHYITTGQVYQEVIRRERNLEYKGEDVEVVPDIPNEIIRRIRLASDKDNAEITVVEFGGTVGEYQVLLFLEAARIMKVNHPDDVAFVLVSYLPLPAHIGEMKTKPTQYAIRTLNAAGIMADFIVARGEQELDDRRKEILGRVCNLRKGTVIAAPDLDSIYDVPVYLDNQKLGQKLLTTLNLKPRKGNIDGWKKLSRKLKRLEKTVKVGVVGKYFATGDFTLADSYISVIEALKHGAWANNHKVELTWINSEDFEKDPARIKELKQYDGILVPGGFGTRGVEGVISTIKYCREKKIPYFGICYGMQLAAVEFARNVMKKKGAHTVEVDETSKNPIIHVNPVQLKNIRENRYGGTMRLGSYDCKLKLKTKAYKAYREAKISERHRHRYEFNNEYADAMEEKGMVISGVNPKSKLVEIIELIDHPWFVGVQFHPEFLSRPLDAHPLFRDFIKAAIRGQKRG